MIQYIQIIRSEYIHLIRSPFKIISLSLFIFALLYSCQNGYELFKKHNIEIESIISQNEKNTTNKIKNIYDFKYGDKVRINDGVFKSCIAIFQSIKSDERVLILLNLLGQEQTININKKSLVGL